MTDHILKIAIFEIFCENAWNVNEKKYLITSQITVCFVTCRSHHIFWEIAEHLFYRQLQRNFPKFPHPWDPEKFPNCCQFSGDRKHTVQIPSNFLYRFFCNVVMSFFIKSKVWISASKVWFSKPLLNSWSSNYSEIFANIAMFYIWSSLIIKIRHCHYFFQYLNII